MRSIARLTAASGLSLAAVALGATAASASPAHHGNKHVEKHHSDKRSAAVFVQSDNLAGNTVVAYSRSADGSLHRAGVHPTGGRGGMLVGSVVDHLASLGSVAYDRANGLLYTVNAGSDSVTVFSVKGTKLTRRQVIPSGGDFPNSIAVHGDLVYVLNARSGGTVQGFHQKNGKLAPIGAGHRALGFDPMMTPEFTSTPGQVLFSPSGRQLLVSTKGDSSSIDVFSVGQNGGLSAKPTVNAEAGAAPFSGVFDAHGHLLEAEAGTNALGVYSLDANGTLNSLSQNPTGQVATCWIVVAGGHAYVSNTGSNNLTGFDVGADGMAKSLGTTTTDGGTVDATASPDGRFVYVQTGARGIVDAFRVEPSGALHQLGSVTVPGAVGGEGIAAS
ncbi:MAG TPA: beta-propeller fold lactonase family protein [Conexibacter sp.]|jgi:6-phosphogluconolactonase (cycloisomerase 2 family)